MITGFFLLVTHLGRSSSEKRFLCKALPFSESFCCYIQKQYTNQAFCNKRKLSLSPFVLHETLRLRHKINYTHSPLLSSRAKKRPTSLCSEETPSEGKKTDQKRFRHSRQAVAKVYLCEKIWAVSGTLSCIHFKRVQHKTMNDCSHGCCMKCNLTYELCCYAHNAMVFTRFSCYE